MKTKETGVMIKNVGFSPFITRKPSPELIVHIPIVVPVYTILAGGGVEYTEKGLQREPWGIPQP